MSRQQVSICVFFLFWFAAKALLYFSNILVAFILWWWEYLNKPFHPSLPGLLGEIDKSRSFLIQGRLSTKKYECMFSLVMHKTKKKHNFLFGKSHESWSFSWSVTYIVDMAVSTRVPKLTTVAGKVPVRVDLSQYDLVHICHNDIAHISFNCLK